MDKFYCLPEKVKIFCDSRADKTIIKNFWKGFSCGLSFADVSDGEPLTLVSGDAVPPGLGDGKEFSVNIGENGFAVRGKDRACLIRGFFALLMKMNLETKGVCKMPCGAFTSAYTVKNRMIHFCVFPETRPEDLKKNLCLAGICQYTHVILEFWGTLRFDVMKELSWRDAFDKDGAKKITDLVRALGMEPVPMFNMLGHASLSRVSRGKHTVLDQNPSLQYLFSPDGWVWNITSEDVRVLHKNIRRELYELFGETEYFHIGCDEAYYITGNDALRKEYLPKHLARLTDEVANEGKIPLMWADMLLEREAFPKEYYAFAKPGESENLIRSLNKKTVLVDWQYNIKSGVSETAEYLRGFTENVMCAAWYDKDNIECLIGTAEKIKSESVMMTTWHALEPPLLRQDSIFCFAERCGAVFFDWAGSGDRRSVAASLLRRVNSDDRENGVSYENTGFCGSQLTGI